MKLFLICHDDEPHENMDWLVAAFNRDQAVSLWQSVWETDVTPDMVYEIPDVSRMRTPQSLSWHVDVKLVN